MRLNVLEWGDPAGPAVMCMHGVSSHAPRFRRLAGRLVGRYRVVSVDLRGHGESDWEPPWDFDTHVGDLLETADALGIDVADWMGHSFGGRLALELAARAPERVRRLVLLDPAVWVPPPRALEIAQELCADESFASPEDAVEARVVRAPLAPRALVEEEVREQLEVGADGRWRYRLCRPAVIAAYGEMSKRPPLERVAAFALLVRGADSEVVPPELVATTRELYAGELEIAEVPGGHVVMWDALEETGAAVERFLNAR